MPGLLTTDGKDSTSSTAGSSTGSYLIPRTLYGTMLEALRKKLVLSALAAKRITQIPGSSLDFPTQTPDSMQVHRVEQGAEIPLDVEAYGGFNMKPLKYGVVLGITKEMIEDSQFDVMALNVQTAAYEFADNEEALIVAQFDAASTAASHDVSNSNATLPVTDITQAMQNLEADNHVCTHIICGVEIVNDIRNIDSFTEADKSGVNDPSKKLIGKIFEMKVLVSNNVSSVLAYVINAERCFLIAEKRPVTIERFFDAKRDTAYAVATQRVVVRYWDETATSEITTT